MTDQLKIEAKNRAPMMRRPASVDSWKAKRRPSAARKLGSRKFTIRSSRYTRTCLAACKIGAALALAQPSHAAEGTVYDVFGKALAPFAAAVFGGGEGQPGAFVAECKVTAATGKLAAAEGMQLRLALQRPDHLRVDLAYNGQLLTACRAGTALWAAPEGPMKTLAQAAGLDPADSAPDEQSTPLVPLALDAKMLAFLPLVFDVQDGGHEDIAGTSHRVLRFGFLPELQKAIKAEPFDAHAWIGDDYGPRRVTVSGRDYSIQVDVDRLTFAPRFPDQAWQPSEGQQVLRLPGSALNELFEKMLAQKIEWPGAGTP
jgi:hypothetical protein